jgi:hypothetical protein
MTWTVSLIVPLVLGLLAKIFPYKTPECTGQLDFETLSKQYQKWEFFALIPLFTFLPLMTFLFGRTFEVLYNFVLIKPIDSVFTVLPHEFMWFVPAGILSFALVGFPMTLVFRLLLKDRYEEYTLFTNLKHGFDGMKIFIPMAWVLGTVATVILFLMTDYFIAINDKGIVMNEFSTLSEKKYSYTEIESINYVKNTISKDKLTVTPYPHYYIKFSDGDYWNTRTGLVDEMNQKDIVNYIAIKSKKKIDTLSYDPD